MKFIHFILFSAFLFSCSNTEPQPLVAGKDECYFCKMPVVDTKFGAEIITEKGKLYKFDDIICMIKFSKEGLSNNEKAERTLVVSYNNQKLMDVPGSVFLKSSHLHTPMNSGVAAFETRSEADSFFNNFPGELLTWQQLQQNLK